jgi:DNA-binding NarL/FixJ family response regulator
MGWLSINVAVVDDQDIIRLGVQQSLSEVPHLTFIGGFSTLEAFAESAPSQKVDVVLLDDSLPDLDTLQAIQTIQAHRPETAVLLLGSRLTARGIHEAIQAGASGVICKTEPVQDVLVMGIRHAHAGKVYMSPGAGLIALQLGSVPAISKCLQDVLVLMADGNDIPDIMRKLDISRKAVYLRCQRLCEILEVKTKEQIVAEAIRRGLLSGNE